MAIPQIHVYDENLKRIKTVDDAESLSWIRKWRGAGQWSLKINAHKVNADYFIEDGYIGFYRDGQYRLGLIEYPHLTTGETAADDVWEFSGGDANALLYRRILQNFRALGTEYDIQAAGVTREAAMRHYVDVEAITPSDASRTIPNLSLEADSGRGGALIADYQGRLQVLGDVIGELAAAGDPDPLGWDILYTPVDDSSASPGTFTFRIRSPRDMTVVKINRKFQTIHSSEYQHNLTNLKNSALVGGAGDGISRSFRTVTDGSGASDISLREVFIDESSYSTDDELDQQGAVRLLEYAAEEGVTAEYNENGSFQYITDFDLGDIVMVGAQDLAMMASTIIIAEEVYEKDGNKVKFTFGSEKPDLISIWARDRKQYLKQIMR